MTAARPVVDDGPTDITVLRTTEGDLLRMEPGRWSAEADPLERSILSGLTGPVLDVGCGPGRLVAHLLASGTTAMGVDTAPRAVALAHRRGAAAIQRSVWERLPGEGRWGAVLLFDGNVGIGGDPVALLRRCRELLGRDGQLLVEVEGPQTASRQLVVRIERGDLTSSWFPWATVSVDGLATLAAGAALRVARVCHTADHPDPIRWFAWLRPVDAGTTGPG